MLANIAFLHRGCPAVIPTFYWRDGDSVYWHGSRASRMLRSIQGTEICLSVTHLDGLVLGRSAFHHSANYRSAILYGSPKRLADDEERRHHLRNMIEHFYPSRWDMLRPMSEQEFKATDVFRLNIDEFSTKVREGGPNDEPGDLAWPVWAGIVPVGLGAMDPIADAPAEGPVLAPPRWRNSLFFAAAT
jgi:nitroimidazol reductase NimA-like FMN-containing flavoprotein (pyridoxamine 5'-phosphate oxidase superfamily)